MLSTFLLTSLLASFAAAQSSVASASGAASSGSASGGNSSSFDASQVGLTTKNQWCQGEQAACPMLCGGTTAQGGNLCSGSDLKYTCTCPNGQPPNNIGDYVGTLPNFICEATFAQCRTNNPGSSACVTCGTLQPSSVPSSTSAGPSQSGSAAATSGGGGSSTGTATAAGTTASRAAAALEKGQRVGVVAVLGGLVAGLLL